MDTPPRPAKCLTGFPYIGKVQMDLMVLAFACDLTRVATLFDGDVHNRRNLPYMLASKAGGKLKTGRYLRFNGNPHNQLYTSFLNLYGVDAKGFGEPAYPGALSGLV